MTMQTDERPAPAEPDPAPEPRNRNISAPAEGNVAIVGAGVFGLFSAWFCLGRGYNVTIYERDRPGSGASGGPLGVLAPHAPGGWTDEKAAHLMALRALPGHLGAVQAAGGPCGYGPVGRVQPLADAEARRRAEAQVKAADTVWGTGSMWIEAPDAQSGWLDPALSRHGILMDRITARLDPRATMASLRKAVQHRRGRLETGVTVTGLRPGGLETDHGPVDAGTVVLAAGSQSFSLLEDGDGSAVKGQAARLDIALAEHPVLYDRGTYVVVHSDGSVAVGSTSEREWSDPLSNDAALDRVLERACALCPAIRGAAVAERWAGLRPRARKGRPLIGRVPGRPGLIAATGGFKIGFGLGAAAGEAVAATVGGEDPGLPETWQF